MIVVADTSVVLNLCGVGQAGLLQILYGRVLIPAEVASEFARLAQRDPRFAGLVLPPWIEISTDSPPIPPRLGAAGLDIGETSAIALCLSLPGDALLIDETLGREVAADLGLRTIGILGVLLDAKTSGQISAVRQLLDRLEAEVGFWIAPALRAKVLALAAE